MSIQGIIMLIFLATLDASIEFFLRMLYHVSSKKSFFATQIVTLVTFKACMFMSFDVS